MATDEQKTEALKQAIEITKVAAQAGTGKLPQLLRDLYKQIICLHDAK